MMPTLNTLFDTSQPIVDQMAEYAQKHNLELPDDKFDQALNEYGLTEADEASVMKDMLNSKIYKFIRLTKYWRVFKRKK